MQEIESPSDTAREPGPVRASARFMRSHPAHWIALGFGSGLSPFAPGTSGTLWAWLVFVLLQPLMTDVAWGVLIALSLPIGWWASTVRAHHLRVMDPGCVVWDEIVAFWLVLWLVSPTGLLGQTIAFALFRYFDAAKPGPVGWADQLFHNVSPATDPGAWRKAGFGIMLDDLVAGAWALLVGGLGRSW